MKTRRSISAQPSYQSEEDYIERNKHICKSIHPKLTFRQIRNKLSSEWNVLSNKPKKQTRLDDFVIQISSSPNHNEKPIPQKQQKKTTKQKQLKNHKISKNQKPLQNKKLKQITISPPPKQVPSIVITDSESLKISLSSQEEKQPIVRENPVIISTNSLQIKEPNQQPQKTLPSIKKEESKCNFQEKQQISKENKKPKIKLPIQKLKLRRLKKLSKLKSKGKPGIPSEFQPVLAQDFINSVKTIDHVSMITISNSQVDQGQVGLDEIKSIVSHTYGIIDHGLSNSERLNFQLFFEVEFQPKENGYVPKNTFCTSKQAAFYCKEMTLEYISKHKDIFTQNDEYYLK
ncbi:unnamed protein product (macronuclear) [Paramecium tetraurelia]|uniref:HMG box domain-containing protein n=1 Tax=Paramecium tetraurelia TaxID=5888 RepID=A0CFR9_PARTE|nr:uncharacterized protein GSPATT00038077001 [Paramecium tetraurelia]CAK69636.1 unnamed protein product [Paramecium tetraurelia]|eukprot:XP_001437033.1 hypothetical protein (macronuclear) [Paramecium tetraurelia strain d4-2]